MRYGWGRVLVGVILALIVLLGGCEAAPEIESEEILEITPQFVTNQQADRELVIHLTSGRFREDIQAEDFSLSEELGGLSITSVTRVDDTTVNIVLSGQTTGHLADPETGTIMISYAAIESESAMIRNAIGELTVGTPYIVNVSEAFLNLQDGGKALEYTFMVEGGSWAEEISLNDIQLEGVFQKMNVVEMIRDEEYLRLHFEGITEAGEGTITFLTTASSSGKKTSFEFHVNAP